MSTRWMSFGTVGVCCLALSCCFVSVAMAVELSYHPEEGRTIAMLSRTEARVPMMGTKVMEVRYELTCTGYAGDRASMKLFVPGMTLPDGQAIDDIEATFMLASDGTVTGLASDQLSDPQVGPVLKNIGMLFPPLPGGEVEPGETWSSRQVLYLPPTKGKNKIPSRIRVDSNFKFVGTDGTGARRITFSIKEAPGEKVRIKLDGQLLLKEGFGPGTGAILSGVLKVRKLLAWISVPLDVRVIVAE